MTLIVNLLGQPCAGKSTTAAGVFYRLKVAGVSVELVTEYAKDLTWEERHSTLKSQVYIFGKQLRNMERLIGKVDVIVTDSPLILSRYYSEKLQPGRYPDSFHAFVTEQFKAMGGINYFLRRVGTYDPVGRNQDEFEADQIGTEVRGMLAAHGIAFQELDSGEAVVETIVGDVRAALA